MEKSKAGGGRFGSQFHFNVVWATYALFTVISTLAMPRYSLSVFLRLRCLATIDTTLLLLINKKLHFLTNAYWLSAASANSISANSL